MKKLVFSAVVLGALSTWSYVAFADQDSLLTRAMEECFRAHARLMDKPAVKNVRACWRAHAHLIETRPRDGLSSAAGGN
jgi:hypothetical protein